MKLFVDRHMCGPSCTIGELSIDGVFACYTLEDAVREINGQPVENWKQKGETAIPRGTYSVIVNHSERFKRDMPLLVGVPGFSGVRIHPGNTAEDTEGCILVGKLKSPDGLSIFSSRVAFDDLFGKIQAALAANEDVSITIT